MPKGCKLLFLLFSSSVFLVGCIPAALLVGAAGGATVGGGGYL